MNALTIKDRPWVRGMGVLGSIGLGFAVTESDFADLFVLGPHRLEVLFYLAGSMGLVLGALAVLWDDMLGTREFLGQRPVSRAGLARSPLRACGKVLVTWMIAVPLIARVLSSFKYGTLELTYWEGLPEILATLAIAWPACAVGCVAAAAPVQWWLRIVFAAALTLTVGMMIDRSSSSGTTASVDTYAFACLVATVVLVPVAAHLNAVRSDPDRPLGMRTRVAVGVLALVSVAYSTSALGIEVISHATRSVQWEYPRIVKGDGKVQLAVRGERGRTWFVCDAEHTPAGSPRPREEFETMDYNSPGTGGVVEIEAPRWSSRYGRWTTLSSLVQLLTHEDGRVWLWNRKTGSLYPTGVGEELAPLWPQPFPQNTDDVGRDPNRQHVIVGNRETGQLLRYDEVLGYFVPLALPNGDTFAKVRYLRKGEDQTGEESAPDLSFLFEREDRVAHIQGAAGAYVMKDGELVAFAAPAEKSYRRESVEGKTVGRDPLSYSIEIPAHDGLESFTHAFEPRTAVERLYTGYAMLASVVRPPVTQLACSVFASDEMREGVFVDRLICGGKRLWLLALCFALAGVGAWLVHRYMRKVGADDSTRRFWVVATALTGPIAVFLAVLVETRRRHARPNLVAPVAPRIVSKTDYTEIGA